MELKRLRALDVTRTNLEPGMHPDGGGLYLRVAQGGSRQWIFRYRKAGKLTDMGLGGVASVSLTQAREQAAEARSMLVAGKVPLAAKKERKAFQHVAQTRGVTFERAARDCIEARKSGWRNAKHAAQWTATLETYAFPTMGKVPVAEIDITMVLRVLQPIWDKKTETASRVRQRIEAVLDYAKVRELRTGDNPARWKGHLSGVLPARTKVQKVQHQPAMPYREVPSFIARLNGQQGVTALALEFLILTAARSAEVTGAAWDEVDLKTATWTIPGNRIKAGREHKVPLSKRAMDIVKTLPHVESHIFSGLKQGSGLSSGAFRALLERMGVEDIVPHGFRSSFRDWAAEQTNYPREVAEAALAHVTGDKVEAAYRRSDLFEKRRKLMEAWASYCEPRKSAKVLPLKRRQ
jgi:integrase